MTFDPLFFIGKAGIFLIYFLFPQRPKGHAQTAPLMLVWAWPDIHAQSLGKVLYEMLTAHFHYD